MILIVNALFVVIGVPQKYQFVCLYRVGCFLGTWFSKVHYSWPCFLTHEIIQQYCKWLYTTVSCILFIRNRSSHSLSPVLALQRWCNYYPSMEFCLYITNHKLIASSQRDCSLYYPFLQSAREALISLLSEFVETRVKDRFPVKDRKSIRED